ncbi:hypothetical protein [Bacillus timonensis]|uniref:hypothetical protein n=1 Tax=Bacillus timonensis TaxID=1033734 RepID=UPI000289A6FF|nr:hypothetical protein [Bacillus timonensis]
MEDFILFLFILLIISLTITFIVLFKKRKVSLIVSGVIMMILAPIVGFSSGALFLHFYDWDSGGTGEGAGFGGAFLGLITLGIGIVIFIIGIIRWIFTTLKK